MFSTAREIAAGDIIILWMTREAIQPLLITPGKDFNNKYGSYRHDDFIGTPYGSKVGSRTGKGFIHVLRPTPELWTMALPHRTQILYLPDIAFVTAHLGIRPGSRVIEAGALLLSLYVRTIGSLGHLWSYEFHEQRANKAREEFAEHGMADQVTLTHRNVCKDGFTVTEEVDAVFLDLPAPWEAIEHAKLLYGYKDRQTRICCFSPCMEQVLRTVNTLNEAGFTEITMYETLIRPHDISVPPALQTIGEIGDKLKEAEARREDKRVRQIAEAKALRAGLPLPEVHGAKRKRDGGTPDELDPKRVKTEGDEQGDLDAAPTTTTMSKVLQEVRGHTSYLTFATLLPQKTAHADVKVEKADAMPVDAEADTSGPIPSV
ncbi:tRNA methyltransferase complex GCD14 subunit-domain-containing protein [Schizophyllum amplum]|uniref:tRNA (adenine(58)-N(1))-methyltransferase catalytic subunit TRM61 n=1 Tax=Schizophyllum amplum TaxID=97359 RepID=A0A550C771_9AGAR|nr:tRNA methyltransferase complex GCD14 subunit-domain-containing protein [Auriculariopsis ampla]